MGQAKGFFIFGMEGSCTNMDGSKYGWLTIKWNNNSISWNTTEGYALEQLNSSGMKYYYTVIG